MDKMNRKEHRINGHKNCRIGIPLGIHDKHGNELYTGDTVGWGNYDGILLWNIVNNCYMFCISYSMWYGDDIYNAESYGKGFELNMDDGARMEMLKMA